MNSEKVPGDAGDNPWVGKTLYQAFSMSLLFRNPHNGEDMPQNAFPKAVMYAVDSDADRLKVSGSAGPFYAYEELSSCPTVGSAAAVAAYTPPTGATAAGWQTPADVIDDSAQRAYKDVGAWKSTARWRRRQPGTVPCRDGLLYSVVAAISRVET